MDKFEDYFNDWEVRQEYKKEFISLWNGWLGEKNCHKLDEVTQEDWNKFNSLIRLIAQKFNILLANFENKRLIKVDDIEDTLSNYEDSMSKSSNEFSYYVIPRLNCVISEDWDYTYIIWHKENNIEQLKEMIQKVGLYHFH